MKKKQKYLQRYNDNSIFVWSSNRKSLMHTYFFLYYHRTLIESVIWKTKTKTTTTTKIGPGTIIISLIIITIIPSRYLYLPVFFLLSITIYSQTSVNMIVIGHHYNDVGHTVMTWPDRYVSIFLHFFPHLFRIFTCLTKCSTEKKENNPSNKIHR